MKTPEQKAAHAAYMREYNRKNRDRVLANRKAAASNPEAKGRKAAQDAAYRAKKKAEGAYSTPEYRKQMAERVANYRLEHPEATKAAKQRYYASAKGKASKRREEAAYRASGGRAAAEARRAEKPVSDARLAARKRWAEANRDYFTAQRSKRRTLEKSLSADDFWVLQEAVTLARMREKVVGGRWHVDHIVPVSKGGTSEPSNLQVVPAAWNRIKSNKHSERFFAA